MTSFGGDAPARPRPGPGTVRAGGGPSLSAGAAAGLLGQFVTIGGGLFAQILVVRHLSAADYGAYSVATTLTYFFAMLLRAGLHGLVVRTVARKAVSAAAEAHRAARHFARLSTVIAVSAIPVLGLVVLPVSNTVFLEGRLGWASIWVLAFTIGAEAGRFVYSECFRGFNRQSTAAALGNAGRTLAFVALVVALVVVDDSPELSTVLALALVASVATAFVAGIALARWTSGVPVPAVRAVLRARTSLRRSSPFLLTEVCSFVLVMADVLVVSVFAGNADVALYATASRAATMLTVPAYVLVGLLSPLVASLWTQGETGRLQSLLTRSLTVTGALTVAGLAGTLWLGGDILTLLFGEGFRSAAPILDVLAFGAVLNVFFGQGIQVLMLCGRARVATATTAAFSVVTLLAEIGAGAVWGVLGVACASASGVAVQQFTLAVVARRLLGVTAAPFGRLPGRARRPVATVSEG